jgi:uncharacterized membrane protein HdeD (DUF308 family)
LREVVCDRHSCRLKEEIMADSMTAGVHRATTWSIVLSVFIMIAGVMAIALPTIAGIAVAVIVGWMLIFAGVLHLFFAWGAGRPGMVIWQILLGLAYGFIGFYVLANPVAGLAGLTFAIAVYLLVEAALEFALAAQVGPVAGRGWLIADGVVTFILATMIWLTWPSSSAWAVGLLIGISMLFSGWTRLMLSLAVRRIAA